MFSVAALGNTQNFGTLGKKENVETTGSVAKKPQLKPLFNFNNPETTGSVANIETTGSVANSFAGQSFSMIA